MAKILLYSYNRVTDTILKQDLVKVTVNIELSVDSKYDIVVMGSGISLLQY